MRASLVMVAMLLFAPMAAANETNGDVRDVMMSFGSGVWPALAVTGHDAGWRVPLPYTAGDACTARLHDLGPARLDRAEKMAPGQSTLLLPRPRYGGSKSYRISFHCVSSKVADLLVHLDLSSELASR